MEGKVTESFKLNKNNSGVKDGLRPKQWIEPLNRINSALSSGISHVQVGSVVFLCCAVKV